MPNFRFKIIWTKKDGKWQGGEAVRRNEEVEFHNRFFIEKQPNGWWLYTDEEADGPIMLPTLKAAKEEAQQALEDEDLMIRLAHYRGTLDAPALREFDNWFYPWAVP